jgi:hypothetical protein
MKYRSLIITAVTSAALLTGAPAALAATSATAAAQVPAVASQSATLTSPRPFHWLYWGTYSTLKRCRDEGTYVTLVLYPGSDYIYSCDEITEGDYFVYKLYIGIPS